MIIRWSEPARSNEILVFLIWCGVLAHFSDTFQLQKRKCFVIVSGILIRNLIKIDWSLRYGYITPKFNLEYYTSHKLHLYFSIFNSNKVFIFRVSLIYVLKKVYCNGVLYDFLILFTYKLSNTKQVKHDISIIYLSSQRHFFVCSVFERVWKKNI